MGTMQQNVGRKKRALAKKSILRVIRERGKVELRGLATGRERFMPEKDTVVLGDDKTKEAKSGTDLLCLKFVVELKVGQCPENERELKSVDR
jgi:hypothetical protein